LPSASFCPPNKNNLSSKTKPKWPERGEGLGPVVLSSAQD
jgi:hypothetical protein